MKLRNLKQDAVNEAIVSYEATVTEIIRYIYAAQIRHKLDKRTCEFLTNRLCEARDRKPFRTSEY